MKTVVAELEYEGKRYTVTRDNWGDDTEENHVWYMWMQGNYSCDCNRLLFMGLDVDIDNPPCGDTVRLLSLTLDGKDLLAPTTRERLAEIGLVGL
jgi:hypothetical protein